MSLAVTAATARKKAKESHYRELLLDSGERVFADAGYDGAKMSAIASEAGVSLATVYRIIGGKWELFRAIHELRGQQLMALAMRHVGSAKRFTPLTVLLRGIAAYVRFLAENPNYLRMHLREGGAWSTGGVLRSQEQIDLWNGGLSIAANMFRLAIEAGELHDDDPPELMVKTMIAMHQVRLAEWIDAEMAGPVDQLERAVQRQLLRAFCPPDVAEQHLATLYPLTAVSDA